jgi:trigger factor
MQVSVEPTEGLQRRLKVSVEEDRIQDAVQSRLKDMSRTVKVKGFRAGKVPLKVVQQQYGKQVRQEVIGDVLQSTFYEAVSQENLRPAGKPSFDDMQSEPGKGLEYTATFEVYPEIELADFAGVTIEKPVVEITDADVDEMIETIRKQHMEWEPVERPAEEGDQVNIDFKGSIDGEVFEGGEGKGMTVVIGSGRMIEGFEEGLKGARAGDDLTLELSFPENYHAKELAGKPVKFEIHVNSVEAPKLPEVDAEFAKKLGVEDGDVEKLRSEIRANMERELKARIKSRIKEAVMDALLKAHDIQVPETLIQSESETVMQQMMQNLASQGLAQQDLKLDPAMFRDQAERRVKLGLIMSEIVRANDIKVDPDRVKAMIEEIAAPYEHPEEVVKWYYGDQRRLAEVESLVFEEQVVDTILEQALVEEKPYKFNELMNPQAQA